MYQRHKLWIKYQSSLHFFPISRTSSQISTVSAILTGTAPLNHWYVQLHYQLLLSTERWLIPSTSTLLQNVWLLGPRIFPPLFAPSPTGRAVSALTLRQTWPSACWHDLPLRPELARWTAVDAGPRNTASLKIQTADWGRLLKSAAISPQQARQSKDDAFYVETYAGSVKALPVSLCHPQVQVNNCE